MRLKTIKLAGFKSFVDPTNVILNSNLTAIVGPNGCGKSNIVDAIRWVIGESSAKQLRGGQLTDVIFSGTAQRKPVGQAAIELLFDNSQAGLGGAYAQYNEISIRREITREGQSQFYLNGSRCRRRDILDVFLGTGLGPDSYAIIEQGVISQLIEGKPEDIRTYLEEAAGISKYRERRRETENRIRGTRENLERLTDVRLEMEKQLDHLKRQANAAERYKTLKQEQRLTKAQLHALHYQSLNTKSASQQTSITEKNTELAAKIAENEQIQTDIEQQRHLQTEANETLNAIQERYYQTGADIASQQQRIQHIQERERQLSKDLTQMENTWQEAEQHLSDDQGNIATLTAEIATLTPQSEQTAQLASQAQHLLEQAEQERSKWQHDWDEFQAEAAKIEQQAQLEKTRLSHLTQKAQELEHLISRLEQQQQQLDWGDLPQQIALITEQSATLKQQLDVAEQQTQLLNEEAQQLRTTQQELQAERDGKRQELQQLQQQQASLEALQQAALGKADQGVSEWLKQQGWAEKPRLLEGIQVASGWETAVETVLSTQLEAICTNNPEDLALAAHSQITGRLAVCQINSSSRTITPNSSQFTALTTKITTDLPIASLLHGIYTANTVAEALALSAKLAPGESLITPEGVWLGDCWVRISKIQDETSGVLQRQQLLQDLQTTIADHQQEQQQLSDQLASLSTTLAQTEEQRNARQWQFQQNSRAYTDLHAQLSAKSAQLEQLQQRHATTQQELQRQQQLLTETQEQRLASQELAEEASHKQHTFSERRSELLQLRESQSTAYANLRQQAQSARQQADELQVRLSSCQSQLHYSQQNIIRAEKQLNQLQERRDDLLLRQEEIHSPLVELQETLEDLSAQRSQIEQELQTARHQVNQLEQQLRSLEQQRVNTEKHTQVLREDLAQIRIEQSTIQAHQENHLQQITEAEYALETLLQELPAEAEPQTWQQRLEQIDNRIQRLGAINLAAIEEYDAILERKTTLDNQDKDLCEALATLEEAIRKIDRESKTRLKDTFERANENFKALYQNMFPGGHAELELTGDEMLTAGVLIRAQPPGKRNTMLHLLSGGEKALTAIALVFALFQLNPAPFCVLDEVDAPLDEANVGRFCRLVQSMAGQVQFIYISHNKVAMQMAQQLVGVTMQEPGVSRLVTVDIDQAMEMVDA